MNDSTALGMAYLVLAASVGAWMAVSGHKVGLVGSVVIACPAMYYLAQAAESGVKRFRELDVDYTTVHYVGVCVASLGFLSYVQLNEGYYVGYYGTTFVPLGAVLMIGAWYEGLKQRGVTS